MSKLDAIGWFATFLFACSYLCRRSATLRWVQAAAALVWIAYGIFLHAVPVVAANVIVAVAAAGSSLVQKRASAG